jgi:hypothetical protein
MDEAISSEKKRHIEEMTANRIGKKSVQIINEIHSRNTNKTNRRTATAP